MEKQYIYQFVNGDIPEYLAVSFPKSNLKPDWNAWEYISHSDNVWNCSAIPFCFPPPKKKKIEDSKHKQIGGGCY